MLNLWLQYSVCTEWNDTRRKGEAWVLRRLCRDYDCCHATFDNVAMEIIIGAESEAESRSVTMAGALFCRAFWERATLSWLLSLLLLCPGIEPSWFSRQVLRVWSLVWNPSCRILLIFIILWWNRAEACKVQTVADTVKRSEGETQKRLNSVFRDIYLWNIPTWRGPELRRWSQFRSNSTMVPFVSFKSGFCPYCE